MSEHRYVMADAIHETERDRLRALESWADPFTVSHLTAIDVAPGWRCLEVGAGAGSVAGWLANGVGATGVVVASDIDTRFLAGLPANVRVRRHNIVTDDLEQEAYDLVHVRSLLANLPDPAATLDRLLAALVPGGWLVAEEPDFGLVTIVGHPQAAMATKFFHDVASLFAQSGIANMFGGRTLPGLVLETDLVDVHTDAMAGNGQRGDGVFDIIRLGAPSIAGAVVSMGLSEDSYATYCESLDSPSTWIVGSVQVAAWGRKPD